MFLIPTFEQYIKGKKFINLTNNKPCYFYDLPFSQKQNVQKDYSSYCEVLKNEYDKQLQATKEKQKQERVERKSLDHPLHNWTEKELQKEIDAWSSDGKGDFEDRYEGCVPDLALSFLEQYEGVRRYLDKKGVSRRYHVEYIEDLFVK